MVAKKISNVTNRTKITASLTDASAKLTALLP
jgi:hypothetical protein